LGGTPKAGLRFHGSTLLAATVASAAARGARRVVVVGGTDATAVAASAAAALGATSESGPERASVIAAQEEPPFGGPGAGIAAGFAAVQKASGGQKNSDFVLVLACDVPEVDGAVGALLTAVREHARLDRVDAVEGADGVVAVDGEGRPQHLLALYRTSALAAAVERHRAAGDLDGLPVRRLVEGLSLAVVRVPPGTTDDVDTWDDAARHGIPRPVESDRPPEGDDDEQRAVLWRWVARLAAELGLEGLDVDIDEVLALAGVAAHAVRRPAAPLTTFVVGYAAGLRAALAAEEGRVDASGAATRAGDIARRLAAEYAIEAGAAEDQAGARSGAPAAPTTP
jgi:molybdopterin-guanine dinucleotide biosynthesis protein A